MTKQDRFTALGSVCVLAFAVLVAAGARGVGWTVAFAVLTVGAVVGHTVGMREWLASRRDGRREQGG